MKSSEVFRWAYRHGATLDFKPVQEGTQLIVTVKLKKNVTCLQKLILRNHDQVADDICRFVQRLADEKHLE